MEARASPRYEELGRGRERFSSSFVLEYPSIAVRLYALGIRKAKPASAMARPSAACRVDKCVVIDVWRWLLWNDGQHRPER
jgi:hypothetical protein